MNLNKSKIVKYLIAYFPIIWIRIMQIKFVYQLFQPKLIMISRSLNLISKMASFSKRQLNANKKKQQKNQDKFQALSSKMDDDVFQQYKKKIQKDTILRNFRRQIFKKEQVSQQFVNMTKLLTQQQNVLDKLVSTGSREDVAKYSKKIMEKLLNKKKIFRQNSVNPVFSDYGDYSSYKSNYAKLEDRNLVDGEKLNRDTSTQKWYQFIQDLPDDYQEKQNIKEQIRNSSDYNYENISISQYGKYQQQKANLAEHISEAQLDAYDNYIHGKQISPQNDLEHQLFDNSLEGVDPSNFNLRRTARLSPDAVNTIYELYLEGWTVRQISKRFGILPQRAKFCIWARATFYDQYLPKYGIQYLIDCMQQEAELGKEYGYMDYGIDIDKLQNSRMPEEIKEWSGRRVDAQRKPEEYIAALNVLQQKKKFSKYEMVEVGNHGKQNGMYSLKEWKIFRGRGSDDVHLRDKTYRGLSKAKRKFVKTYY